MIPIESIVITGIDYGGTVINKLYAKPQYPQRLVVDITPEDASNKKLSYHSSNETIATIDEDGYITIGDFLPGELGMVTFTVSTTDGSELSVSRLFFIDWS